MRVAIEQNSYTLSNLDDLQNQVRQLLLQTFDPNVWSIDNKIVDVMQPYRLLQISPLPEDVARKDRSLDLVFSFNNETAGIVYGLVRSRLRDQTYDFQSDPISAKRKEIQRLRAVKMTKALEQIRSRCLR